MDERSETDRINDLEAWAFRAGRDLAEIKGSLREKSTVTAVDALHQDVVALREEVRTGLAAVQETQAEHTRALAGHSSTLREILSMLGSLHDHITRGS